MELKVGQKVRATKSNRTDYTAVFEFKVAAIEGAYLRAGRAGRGSLFYIPVYEWEILEEAPDVPDREFELAEKLYKTNLEVRWPNSGFVDRASLSGTPLEEIYRAQARAAAEFLGVEL